MSFIIEINGKDITTIEEIRENFDIDVLLSHENGVRFFVDIYRKYLTKA